MSGRLAVTGASGFVGCEVVRRAAEAGWDVTGIVRSQEGARKVSGAGGRPAMVGDLGPGALVPALGGAHAVVHLAMIGAERGGATYEAVNVGGTRRVIAAAREAAVPRVILFSGLGVAHYGLAPRCTNPYFLSKLSAEAELFRSDRQAVVFRPSYIVGPGDGFVSALLRDMAKGEVERPGDGRYRLQPIALRDAAAAVVAALEAALIGRVRVFDLVGPEAVTFVAFLDRVATVARLLGRAAEYRVREVPIVEAARRAAAGGYRGMLPDELDCLLCDEVSDPVPLEALLGRPLTPLDDSLRSAVAAAEGA